MIVRARIAPSPTGFPHIGTIFQALINYAFAKNADGQFIVRIEDTDRTRYVEGAEDAIFQALEWFGITPDESPRHDGKYGPYRQSEKLDRYKERAEWLVGQSKAYYCFCTAEELDQMRKEQQKAGKPPMYNGKCRELDPKEAKKKAQNEPHVIRMKIISTEATLNINDDIRGVISFEKNLIDDQVILKSDGYPTYHLGVVVDDYDMKITHVIRGEEWISSTPKHVLLRQYFGWDKEPLSFLHTPLLRNPDGSKLSKRNNHAAVSWYKEKGFLAEAILNYLANLVFNHPKGEIYSLEEFIKSFGDRKKMHSVGARFDLAKLEWMNGEYIRRMEKSKLKTQIYEFFNKKYPEELIEKIIPLVQERIKTLLEFETMAKFFFERPVSYEKEIGLSQKKQMQEFFEPVVQWNHDELLQRSRQFAEEKKLSFKDFAMDMRIILTGSKIGPPLFESIEILGKEETLERLK